MKRNEYEELGTFVKVFDDEDALNILKIISKNTWIHEIPDSLVELIGQKYNTSLNSIKYVPNMYFKLNKDFQKDKKIIKATIKAFRSLGHIQEINIRARPILTRKTKNI